jgi:outer membrane protein OmpA-like peptidoglycan-associated protein
MSFAPQVIDAVSGPTPQEIEDWKASAIASVQAHWGSRYTFFTPRAGWDTLPPVNVSILIEEAPEAGADKAHFVTTVNKWPNEPGLTESVTPPGATDDQSTARFHESGAGGIENLDTSHFTETTASRQRYGDADRDNPGTILFGLESDALSAVDRGRLETFGATLGAPDMPPFAVTVTGHASSDGKEAYNLSLSERRAEAVSEVIVKAGAKKPPTTSGVGEAGAGPTPDWRRVDITVGSFQGDQQTVRHEFGHMFGLGDEYPEADQSLAERLRRRLTEVVTGRPDTSRPVGTPVAHSALAERLIPGQEPILAHDSDNIMSAGETIRPHHYVTFLEVLGTMTGTAGEWDVRPGPGHSPQGPGDFPTPAPGGPVTA